MAFCPKQTASEISQRGDELTDDLTISRRADEQRKPIDR
jgi:hypothetical protein